MTSSRKLVIVESPAKARTIAGYLGSGLRRSRPAWATSATSRSPPSCPPEMKKGPFGKFAVDVDNDFEAYYVVDADKKKKVTELKRALKDADELYLATDEDREGEAIAWHLLEVLEPKVPVTAWSSTRSPGRRSSRALENTRDLDDRLVDAQETRRILDRLVGYEVSPVLWRKVRRGLSAGRVQSVATRLVVERERERMAFRSASYWDVVGTFTGGPPTTRAQFAARLIALDGAGWPSGATSTTAGLLKAAAAGRRRPPPARPRPARSSRSRRCPRRVGPHGGEAVHPPSGRAVHHLHAAAGGQPQAAVLRPADDARRAGPVRERLHHLHAYRLDRAVGRRPSNAARSQAAELLRRRVRAGQAADLPQQVEERAGGARGRPPRRGLLPHPRAGVRPAARRRVPALRADLEAHRRLADGGRPRLDRDRPAGRHRGRSAEGAPPGGS